MDCFQKSIVIVDSENSRTTPKGFYLNPKTELSNVNAMFSIAQNYLKEPEVAEWFFQIVMQISNNGAFIFHLSKDKDKRQDLICNYVNQVSYYVLFLIKIIKQCGEKYPEDISRVSRSLSSMCHHLVNV